MLSELETILLDGKQGTYRCYRYTITVDILLSKNRID